ncbi:MAG: hypothetical protein HY047_18510 [Acidobacteria bacterium]|nr:hypothetical protein [Acidobacteriota bacterium]
MFCIAAVVVLAFGWQNGEPWTASAFVFFFSSRVARSIVKRPLNGVRDAHPTRHATRFVLVTAAGWLGSGALAAIAALMGEGQEWWYVAPVFVVFGVLNLLLLSSRTQ